VIIGAAMRGLGKMMKEREDPVASQAEEVEELAE